jgi:hypothetical protein
VESVPGVQGTRRLSYVLTQSAMTEAARLQNGLTAPAFAGAAMFIAMLAPDLWDSPPATLGIFGHMLLAPVVVGLLFFVGFGLLSWFVTIPMRSAALVRQNPTLFGSMELIEDAEGVEFKGASSTTRLPWSEFRGFRENSKIFLLCLSKTVVYPIPKVDMKPEAIEQIRQRWLQRLKPLK